MTAKPGAWEQDVERLAAAVTAKLEGSGPWVRWRAPHLLAAAPIVAVTGLLGVLWLAVPLVALSSLAVSRAEHRWGMRRWRSARLRHRWEHSELGRGSRIKRVVVHDRGFVTCHVKMRSGNWDGLRANLDLEGGKHLRELRLDKRWGEPFRFKLSAHGHANPHRSRTLSLYYRRLPNSWTGLEPYRKPFRYPYLAIGESYEGTVFADMRAIPHIAAVGATRSGKGVWVKGTTVSAIRGGCLGVTIDGGASPEHGPLDDCPTWRTPMSDPTLDLADQLRAAIGCVADIHAEALNRKAICGQHGVDTWQMLPADVKRQRPPIFLIVDELTTLLMPTGDDETDKLRKTLAVKLNTEGLRNSGKFGVMVILSDQMFYSGTLSKGATAQARGRLILGNFASEHERQMAGFTGLPTITEENLAGHWVIANDPTSLEEIRVYPTTRDDLVAAVAWSRGEETP